MGSTIIIICSSKNAAHIRIHLKDRLGNKITPTNYKNKISAKVVAPTTS